MQMEVDMAKTHLKRPAAQARAYSQAVVSEGGKVVWLAGQVAAEDASGKSLAGDFDGQVREVFSRLTKTLDEAGGALADMVTMTVFITDARLGDRFTQLRKGADHRRRSRAAGIARRSAGCRSDRLSDMMHDS
jgi:2-iminobutanoate/2-iminopropanoate deaminase